MATKQNAADKKAADKKAEDEKKAADKKAKENKLLPKEDWEEETTQEWLSIMRNNVNSVEREIAVRKFCEENNLEFHCIY